MFVLKLYDRGYWEMVYLHSYVYPEAVVTVKTAAINQFNTVPYMGVSRLLLPSLKSSVHAYMVTYRYVHSINSTPRSYP